MKQSGRSISPSKHRTLLAPSPQKKFQKKDSLSNEEEVELIISNIMRKKFRNDQPLLIRLRQRLIEIVKSKYDEYTSAFKDSEDIESELERREIYKRKGRESNLTGVEARKSSKGTEEVMAWLSDPANYSYMKKLVRDSFKSIFLDVDIIHSD